MMRHFHHSLLCISLIISLLVVSSVPAWSTNAQVYTVDVAPTTSAAHTTMSLARFRFIIISTVVGLASGFVAGIAGYFIGKKDGEKEANSKNSNNTCPSSAHNVSFKMSMAAMVISQSVSPNALLQMTPTLRSGVTDRFLTGTMNVRNTSTNAVTTFDWTMSVDETTWLATSDKTIVLEPGSYEFMLMLSEGNQQYMGSSTFTITDGENLIPLTIRPVIGDTVTDIHVATQLAVFRFQYNASELALSNFTNPMLGIKVDGGTETLYSLNLATGISNLFVALPVGSHAVHINLYDGNIQRGQSVASQENITVAYNSTFTFDLIPLNGDVSIVPTVNGGPATIRITVPDAVVTEAGGLSRLRGVVSIAGDLNTFEELEFDVTQTGGATPTYQASMTFPSINYDSVTLAFSFYDSNPSPDELIATCSTTTTLDNTTRNVSCGLTLQRRGIVSGNLLGVVGINVYDNNNLRPVSGARVYANGVLLGVTGGGTIGTRGYIKLSLVAGNYIIRAETNTKNYAVNLAVMPLSINNIAIGIR